MFENFDALKWLLGVMGTAFFLWVSAIQFKLRSLDSENKSLKDEINKTNITILNELIKLRDQIWDKLDKKANSNK